MRKKLVPDRFAASRVPVLRWGMRHMDVSKLYVFNVNAVMRITTSSPASNFLKCAQFANFTYFSLQVVSSASLCSLSPLIDHFEHIRGTRRVGALCLSDGVTCLGTWVRGQVTSVTVEQRNRYLQSQPTAAEASAVTEVAVHDWAPNVHTSNSMDVCPFWYGIGECQYLNKHISQLITVKISVWRAKRGKIWSTQFEIKKKIVATD